MVAELQSRMSRGEIAVAIGVEEQEVDEIASGFVPDEEVGSRLRELAASGGRRSGMRVPVWAVGHFPGGTVLHRPQGAGTLLSQLLVVVLLLP